MTHDWSFAMPKATVESLRAIVSREMPGVDFEVMRDELQGAFICRMKRRVEYCTYLLSDGLNDANPNAINYSTMDAISLMRRTAIHSYGLQAEIARQVDLAMRAQLQHIERDLIVLMDKYRTAGWALDDKGGRYVTRGALPLWAMDVLRWFSDFERRTMGNDKKETA